MPELPPFAPQWIRQWKEAAPILQAIRDEELRRMNSPARDTAPTPSAVTPLIFDSYPERHGMVTMQRWFVRRYLLEQTQLKQIRVG